MLISNTHIEKYTYVQRKQNIIFKMSPFQKSKCINYTRNVTEAY